MIKKEEEEEEENIQPHFYIQYLFQDLLLIKLVN
jgi:hypothetical protein